MREDLSRGKIIDSDKWIEGYYVKHQKRMICPIGDSLKNEDIDHFIFFDSFADWNMPRTLTLAKIKPETLGKFIGKVDYNGKKIFEGDMLKVMGYDKPLLAWWYDSCCSFGFGTKNDMCLYCNETESHMIEVIGNIYDNPELMG